MVQRITKLLQQVSHTDEHECDCSVVYEMMDELAEMTLQGNDLAQIVPDIQHHLDVCGCCRAELRTLLRVLKSG